MDITSDTTTSGVFLGQDRRPRLTWRILLAWLGFFGCVLITDMTIQAATARLPPVGDDELQTKTRPLDNHLSITGRTGWSTSSGDAESMRSLLSCARNGN